MQSNKLILLGWLMMGIGINEITEKNIPEILFRIRFLDFVWGKPYFVHLDPSDKSHNNASSRSHWFENRNHEPRY